MSHSPEDHTLRNPPPGFKEGPTAHHWESNFPEDPDPIREALWLIVDREYDIPTNQAMKALDALHARLNTLTARIKELEAELAEANEVIESAGRGMS